MAVLHKSVLGTFTNKVGGVVGSSWKGIPVVRSLPASVANPQSSAQMTQRMRFSLMIMFASLILTGWIRPLWNRHAKRMSGFNAFVRANMQAFNLDGEIVLPEILASNGRLLAPLSATAAVAGTTLTITVTHPTNERYGTVNDEIYVLVFDYVGQVLKFAGSTNAVRGNLATTVVTITNITSANNAIFIAYRHPRGIFVSRSFYTKTGTGLDVITPTSAFLFSFAKKMKIDTSNIDTTLDEAGAIAVLKQTIKEKIAMKDIKIKSDSVINLLNCPGSPEFMPEAQDIDIEKLAELEECGNQQLSEMAAGRGKSTNKSAKN